MFTFLLLPNVHCEGRITQWGKKKHHNDMYLLALGKCLAVTGIKFQKVFINEKIHGVLLPHRHFLIMQHEEKLIACLPNAQMMVVVGLVH